ncbi:MAG: hypothetical protein Fur0040_12700 [Sideroxydans sp.]
MATLPMGQLLGHEKSRVGLGFGVCLLMSFLLTFSQTGDRISRKLLDQQFALLRTHFPKPIERDVVIIGVDEGTYQAFPEPDALWHAHWERLLRALAQAQPAVLGVDVALPPQSYDFLVPHLDQHLVDGLRALAANTPVVLARTRDENGKPGIVFSPFVEAAGGADPVTDVLCADDDGIVRRADPNRCSVYAQGATLVEAMAASMGQAGEVRGLLDYTLGTDFNYIPMQQVLAWAEQGNEERLRQTLGGRPVLLGRILRAEDRVYLPVTLAAWEPENHHLPAMLARAQALRSVLHQGALTEFHPYLVLSLSLLATVFWFARLRWYKFLALFVFPFALVTYSTWLLYRGQYLPAGGILLSGLSAFALRSLYELHLHLREGRALRSLFGSYLSAEALKALLAGKVQTRLEGERRRLCILYADIRHFGQQTATYSPEQTVWLLNQYFSEMAKAIHQHGGAVGRFDGDAVMAYFGAPQALEQPEKNALEAAQEMLLRLRQVNARLKEQQMEPIEIGIGIEVGEAIIGHVGSEARHEYSAIGEVIGVTMALAKLSGETGFPVLCSSQVAHAVERAGGLTELGERQVGGVPLAVCGWYPPLLAAN